VVFWLDVCCSSLPRSEKPKPFISSLSLMFSNQTECLLVYLWASTEATEIPPVKIRWRRISPCLGGTLGTQRWPGAWVVGGVWTVSKFPTDMQDYELGTQIWKWFRKRTYDIMTFGMTSLFEDALIHHNSPSIICIASSQFWATVRYGSELSTPIFISHSPQETLS
jgi:hypothetical protein